MDRMPSEEQFVCVNIRDFLNPEETGGIGENDLEKILSDFSNPKNSDVEFFLKKNAIEFTKKNQSVTYLVFFLEDMCLVGYFSITMKSVTVNAEGMSNSVKRKLSRLSNLDQSTGSYIVAAYLIAQLGRNYNEEVKYPITGNSPNPLLQVTSEPEKRRIIKTLKATEGYVLFACIAMGLVQMLCLKYEGKIWVSGYRYLRTPSR